MLLVRVGDVVFHGHTSSGFLIGPGGFKGWEGAPATKRTDAERPGAHGVSSVPVFKGARLVSLSGTALASSEAGVTQLGDVLAGLGQQDQRLTVTTVAGTRWSMGSVEGPISFDRVGGAAEASFAVSFLLPDPFKYGESRSFVSSGADVQLWHRGNAASWPVVTVSGSFPSGYRIVHPGGSFRVGSALSAGSTDVVDFRRGTVHRNGVLLSGVVLTADRRSVPGGVSVPMRVEAVSSGSGQASFAVVDTFL